MKLAEIVYNKYQSTLLSFWFLSVATRLLLCMWEVVWLTPVLDQSERKKGMVQDIVAHYLIFKDEIYIKTFVPNK